MPSSSENTINDQLVTLAADYLRANDPHLAPIVEQFGAFPHRPHHNYYEELVDSIVSQQLSVKAASAIMKRFMGLFGGDFPTPEQILLRSAEEFRSAGLSYAKAKYIQDLAVHIIDGKVKFNHLDKLDNQQIIDELTAVKGIGVWTVHMFLIFCMGRSDVLATGDLGIRNGIKKLYNFSDLPTNSEIAEVAQKYHWHPYESIACWYIWQSLDNAPKV